MRATARPRPPQLIAKLKTLEHASAALVCDSGMQATALAFDVLMEPGAHAVLMRQVYNKTRSYLEWMAARIGGSVTIVDDGDMAALAAAITPGHAIRVRRDVHQPAGARAGSSTRFATS